MQISAWMACGKCLVLTITRSSLLVLFAQNGVMISTLDSQLSTLWEVKWTDSYRSEVGSNPGVFINFTWNVILLHTALLFQSLQYLFIVQK